MAEIVLLKNVFVFGGIVMFFFLWRLGTKTTKDYGPAYMVKCGNCKIDTCYHLIRERTWITFYRQLVMPYLSEYFFTCHDCKIPYRLGKNDIKSAKRLVKITALYSRGKVTKDEYDALISNLQKSNKIFNEDNSWECPNCRKDNRNSSYRCSYCGYRIE